MLILIFEQKINRKIAEIREKIILNKLKTVTIILYFRFMVIFFKNIFLYKIK